jgi:dynactin complex subunit
MKMSDVYLAFQLLDELGKELEELRKYKIEHAQASQRPRNNSMAELPSRYQALNTEVNRLKEVSIYKEGGKLFTGMLPHISEFQIHIQTLFIDKY